MKATAFALLSLSLATLKRLRMSWVFPSRPTKGGRILRVFTNISSTASRVWHTTDRFAVLAQQFAGDAGLQEIAASTATFSGSLRRRTYLYSSRQRARFTGLGSHSR